MARAKMIAASAILISLLATASSASPPEAWEEFRRDVERQCTALADAQGIRGAAVSVDPYGTESYGVAIIIGGDGQRQNLYVCVYDKRSQQAELSSAFEP